MDHFCAHRPDQHAPLAEFGMSMCLVPDCDCDGTVAQVAAAKVARARRMSPTAELVYATVLEVLSNPMVRSTDDAARNVAAALVATFEMVPR